MIIDDLRSVPDRVLQLYLWSVGAWAICLLAFFVTDRIGVALTLCLPLSVWLGILTVWWWTKTRLRLRKNDLNILEVNAGVQTVGRILSASGMIPGIIFLANDPLIPAAWGTFLGISATSAVAWYLVNLTARLKSATLDTIVLICAGAVLPLNATGAVSLGAFLGWFEQVGEFTGVPIP